MLFRAGLFCALFLPFVSPVSGWQSSERVFLLVPALGSFSGLTATRCFCRTASNNFFFLFFACIQFSQIGPHQSCMSFWFLFIANSAHQHCYLEFHAMVVKLCTSFFRSCDIGSACAALVLRIFLELIQFQKPRLSSTFSFDSCATFGITNYADSSAMIACKACKSLLVAILSPFSHA